MDLMIFFGQVSTYLKSQTSNGCFDFLINNAGTGIYQSFVETTEEQFDEMCNVHFKGVYFLTQKALPYLNDGGRIINMSSGLVRYSFPTASAYAYIKGAIDVFTRYVAKELAHRKITENIVAPVTIATDFGVGENKTNTKKIDFIANSTALGRIGQPDDIGTLLLYYVAKMPNG